MLALTGALGFVSDTSLPFVHARTTVAQNPPYYYAQLPRVCLQVDKGEEIPYECHLQQGLTQDLKRGLIFH